LLPAYGQQRVHQIRSKLVELPGKAAGARLPGKAAGPAGIMLSTCCRPTAGKMLTTCCQPVKKLTNLPTYGWRNMVKLVKTGRNWSKYGQLQIAK
jgi:hypothetical protein